MGVYVIVLSLTLVFSILENKVSYKTKKHLFNICLFLLWSVSALRGYNVGTDTLNYLYNYNHLDFKDIRGTEYGWYLLSWICKNIFSSYRLLIFIVSFFTVYYLSKAIKRSSTNWCLSLYYYISFYFFFQSLNISRQLLAASILLYAFTFIKEKKITKYLLLTLLATSIHTSALVVIPLYFIRKMVIPKIGGIILIICSFMMTTKIIPFVVSFMIDSEIYATYVYNGMQDESYLSTNLLLHSLVALFLLLFNKENGMYYTIFFIGLITVNLLSLFEVIGRIGIYMKMSIILILPEIHTIFKSKLFDKFASFGFMILLYLACLIMMMANTEGVYPYSLL